MAGREARRAARRRHRRAAAAAARSTTSCAASSASAAGARKPTRACARSCARSQFEPPLALRQLAQITDFDLFVTTTFDPLLEQAINLERYGGAAIDRGHRLRAQPRRRPAGRARASCSAPVVYHLLGRLSASPTYVVSDEDMLEFICALQSEHLTPEKLFHELEHNHLLLIGSDFSNWLARLFLRMAKRQRLSDPRDVGEVLADDHTMQDERLVAFLQQVSVRTRVYGGAEAFVAELHARWTARQQPGAASSGAAARRSASCRRRARCRTTPIFISYAREDLPAVQRLKAALDAAGLTTWFDLDRLEGGDDYDRKIQRNIARCSFFIPVISATTQRRHEALFPPRVELRGRPRAQHRRGRACSSCRSASTTRPRPRRWCRTSSGRCTSRALPGGEPCARVPAPAAGSVQREPPHECRRSTATAGRRSRSIRRTRGWACPRSPRRRAPISTAATRRPPSSRAACSASC